MMLGVAHAVSGPLGVSESCVALGTASVCQGGPAASGQRLLVAESGPLWLSAFLLACFACSV